ncbi:hypothetical protein FB451DRAFT_1193126 [Mycena latifolia]|nr:hypothetical protein FB451DRAFT_1193126 [Mycena latifolia]
MTGLFTCPPSLSSTNSSTIACPDANYAASLKHRHVGRHQADPASPRLAPRRRHGGLRYTYVYNYVTWKFFHPPRLNQLRAPRKWQPISLERLFVKTAKESLRTRRGERMARRAQEEEQMYMQVMAELDAADNTPDDGEVEIDDSEVYEE